jgi:hypothetical protein
MPSRKIWDDSCPAKGVSILQSSPGKGKKKEMHLNISYEGELERSGNMI